MTPTSIKKKIAHDWADALPGLSLYAQNKLYKVLGPTVIGIEIFSLPRSDDYRPYLAIYPLWKETAKSCMDEPSLLVEIRNKKKLQFDIPYAKHDLYFQEAVQCTQEQVLISLQMDVLLKDLFSYIDLQFAQPLIKASPVGTAKLFEYKLLSAFYVNSMMDVNNVLNDVIQTVPKWPYFAFDWKYGSIDKWINGLQEQMDNRSAFLEQIDANLNDKKLSALNRSKLLI